MQPEINKRPWHNYPKITKKEIVKSNNNFVKKRELYKIKQFRAIKKLKQ